VFIFFSSPFTRVSQSLVFVIAELIIS